jgi:hypothetical protein
MERNEQTKMCGRMTGRKRISEHVKKQRNNITKREIEKKEGERKAIKNESRERNIERKGALKHR